MEKFQFASDNVAGICPEAWEALERANREMVSSYGEDPYSSTACDLVREVFETDCDVFFVFNGTAANALALASLCQSYHAVVCHEKAHVQTDECGAPEFFSGGIRLLPRGGALGKLSADAVEAAVTERRDLHFSKPRVLSLTQATELGTVYSEEEQCALVETARRHDLAVHMDGARFANAVASGHRSPGEMTWKSGIDVLSFGATKLGTGIGDAVVFFDRDLSKEFDYRCKQAGQLASKMRFISAGWCGLLQDGLWLDIARRSNAMAQRLRSELSSIAGVEILFPTEANAVFARFPPEVNRRMEARGWHYYSLAGCGDSRLMCSWLTTEEDIGLFAAELRASFGENEAAENDDNR